MTKADPSFATRTSTGLSSGEGLIWALRDPSGADPRAKDPRLLVVEAEFASVLKAIARDINTLSPVLRSAWDGRPWPFSPAPPRPGPGGPPRRHRSHHRRRATTSRQQPRDRQRSAQPVRLHRRPPGPPAARRRPPRPRGRDPPSRRARRPPPTRQTQRAGPSQPRGPPLLDRHLSRPGRVPPRDHRRAARPLRSARASPRFDLQPHQRHHRHRRRTSRRRLRHLGLRRPLGRHVFRLHHRQPAVRTDPRSPGRHRHHEPHRHPRPLQPQPPCRRYRPRTRRPAALRAGPTRQSRPRRPSRRSGTPHPHQPEPNKPGSRPKEATTTLQPHKARCDRSVLTPAGANSRASPTIQTAPQLRCGACPPRPLPAIHPFCRYVVTHPRS